MTSKMEDYLDVPSKKRFYDLLGSDDETVVWVDWHDEETSIVEAVESILKTGELRSEYIDSDNEHGFDFHIEYRGKKKRTSFATLGTHNRQEAIVALNELLSPDYEVRFCVDSNGNDTLAYIPLSCDDWRRLEEKYGPAKVRRRFYPIDEESPNMFTDRILPLKFVNGKMCVHKTSGIGNVLIDFLRSLFGR